MFLLPKRPLKHCRIPGSLLNEESVLVADAHHCHSLNLVLGCPHGTEARGGHAPSLQPHGPLPRDPCSCRPSSAGNRGRPARQDMHGYETHKTTNTNTDDNHGRKGFCSFALFSFVLSQPSLLFLFPPTCTSSYRYRSAYTDEEYCSLPGFFRFEKSSSSQVGNTSGW